MHKPALDLSLAVNKRNGLKIPRYHGGFRSFGNPYAFRSKTAPTKNVDAVFCGYTSEELRALTPEQKKYMRDYLSDQWTQGFKKYADKLGAIQ